MSPTARSPFSSVYYRLTNSVSFSSTQPQVFAGTTWTNAPDNWGAECWVRMWNTNQPGEFQLWGTRSDISGLGIVFNSAFGLRGLHGGLGGQRSYIGSGYMPGTNEWVNVAVVRSQGTNSFYVNGALHGPQTTNALVLDNGDVFRFPVIWTNNVGASGLDLDEGRVFNVVSGFNPATDMGSAAITGAPVALTQIMQSSQQQEGSNVLVQAGENVTLQAPIMAGSNLTYIWAFTQRANFNGGPTLTLTNVTPADAGIYFVVATNASGGTVTFGWLTVRQLIVPVPATNPTTLQQAQINRQYGALIHFGANTFNGVDIGTGLAPAASYVPSALNPRQWVQTAHAAGMKYIVQVAKHLDGFCLWPSAYTELLGDGQSGDE